MAAKAATGLVPKQRRPFAPHRKSRVFAGCAMALLLHPALAADDEPLTSMALCRDSWVEWNKTEPAKLKAFGERFRAQFSRHDNDPYALPKSKVSVLGFPVLQAFPESVGMGVGFSLTVDATFDQTRGAVEKAIGKSLTHCESGEDMKTCELEIAPQRTVTLLAEDKANAHRTLIGCYYFYEK
jgi:hypothetical protein